MFTFKCYKLAAEDDAVEQDMSILHLAQALRRYARQQASNRWALLRIIHGTYHFLPKLIVCKFLDIFSAALSVTTATYLREDGYGMERDKEGNCHG
jgi:hypothetical protein